MGWKIGKGELESMIQTLEGDHETVEAAAKAVLATAEEIFQKRAQFVVVGQVISTKEKPFMDLSDPEAAKMSLGWYSTEGDAASASESLFHSARSGVTMRTWVLPVHHGTPSDYHGKLKEAIEKKNQKIKDKQIAKIQKSIELREKQQQKWLEEYKSNGGVPGVKPLSV